MAFTYGFYNYNENDADQKLYDAIQMSQLFDGIITDGVYGHVGSCFRITASSLENAVKVGDGRAWFNHTWNYNDATITLEDAHIAPATYDRIDAVILEIDSNKNARRNRICWKTGLEAEEPSRPVMVHGKDYNEYALAYIYRTPGENIIKEEDIINAVGTPETPYVTGVLETLDTSQILSAFQNDFNRLYSALENLLSETQAEVSERMEEYDEWFDSLTPIIKTSIITDGIATFTDIPVGNEYYIEFFTETPDIDYLSCSLSGTTCTVNYGTIHDGTKVYCKISKVAN